MSGQTVNDVLISHRPEANHLEFKRMIQTLEAEVGRAWSNRGGQRPSDVRYAAAIHHVALIQTYQQLGWYDEARQSWNDLQCRLNLGQDVPDSLRRLLGEEAGDHAATVFFHLDLVKSRFNTESCQRHLDNALERLNRPANKAEFYWRHCMNDLVAGLSVDFRAERDRYFKLTESSNHLVARANMLAIESLQQSLLAGGSGPRKRQHAEDALWLYLEANTFSDDLLNHQNHPYLTTHTILCGARHKILLRRRIDFLSRVNDRETEYRRCLKLIERLRTEAEISLNADGFRENAVAFASFIDECRPWEPTSPGGDPGWIWEHHHGDRAAKLSRIMKMTSKLLE